MVILLALEPQSKQTTWVHELAGVELSSPTIKFMTCGFSNPDTLQLTLKPDIFVSY